MITMLKDRADPAPTGAPARITAEPTRAERIGAALELLRRAGDTVEAALDAAIAEAFSAPNLRELGRALHQNALSRLTPKGRAEEDAFLAAVERSHAALRAGLDAAGRELLLSRAELARAKMMGDSPRRHEDTKNT